MKEGVAGAIDAKTPWLAHIPPQWEVVRLARVAKLVKRAGAPDAELLSLYLGEGVIPYKADRVVHATSEDVSGYQLVMPGDLVLNNQQAWRGSVAVSRLRGIISPAYLVCELSPLVDSHFGGYLFASSAAKYPLAVSSRGVGSIQRNIHWPTLRGQRYPLPSLPTQRAIADFLDREMSQIDELVAEQKRLIRLLRERRLSVVTSVALGGINNNVSMSPRDISKWGTSLAIEGAFSTIPTHWDVQRFKTVTRPRDERNDGLREVMLSLRITGEVVDRAESGSNQEPSDASVHRYLVARAGNLVVNPMWLTGGSIGVADRRGAVSPDYRVFSISSMLEPRYLHVVLRSRPYFEQYKLYIRANTTFDRRIKQIDIDNLPVPVPPLDEQRAIVAHLDAATAKIDALIGEAERNIALSMERRAALITDAVTGRIDIEDYGS